MFVRHVYNVRVVRVETKTLSCGKYVELEWTRRNQHLHHDDIFRVAEQYHYPRFLGKRATSRRWHHFVFLKRTSNCPAALRWNVTYVRCLVQPTLLRYRSAVSQDVFSMEPKHVQQPVLRASLASLLRFQREVFWNVPEPWAVARVIHGIAV